MDHGDSLASSRSGVAAPPEEQIQTLENPEGTGADGAGSIPYLSIQRESWPRRIVNFVFDAPTQDRMPRQHERAPLWFLRRIAQNMFGMDYRALALLRISFALCLLWVTYTHGIERRAFYTDEGTLSRSALMAYTSGPPAFSLHLAGGGMAYITTLFVIQFILAFMMLVGYRTRIATIGSYILLFSLQNRHPLLMFGADIVMRVNLFWMMFLPLGQRYSLDSLTGRAKPPKSNIYLGIAGIAYILQFFVLYLGTAAMKVGWSWRVDHTAVSYALALDVYSRPFGHWMSQFDGLNRFLTISTMYLEAYGPFLLILPIFSRWGRLLAVALFAGLQVGFGMCMTLGYFGVVMVAIMMVYMPGGFFERLGAPLMRRLGKWCSGIGAVAAWCLAWIVRWWKSWVAREQARFACRLDKPPLLRWAWIPCALARDIALLVLMWMVLLWNIGNAPHVTPLPQYLRLSPRMSTLGYAIGLNQIWDMFAPNPMTCDGWFVVAGTLNNGRTVDLMTGTSPVTFDRPESVSGSYQGMLWMSYLISFWTPDASSPEAFALYLRKVWDEKHPNAEEKMQSIEINMMYEETLPGPTKSEVTRTVVWTEWFW